MSAASGSSKDQGDVSLLEFLDTPQLNCLNEASDHPLKPIVEQKKKNTTSRYLLSDADEQLLLNIPFNQAVRIKYIAIRGAVPGQAPKKLKLAINRPSIGFDDVEDAEEPSVAQVLELSEEEVRDGTPVEVRYVRFQSVNSLHIFVASNQGGEDETRIDSIDIIGVSTGTSKELGQLKKIEDH